ncbi:short chain dehydrogenase/reductase family oxidoreductase [Staphylococcus intermedius NCTC 11048]|uniref:Short chain dehydrogenase/reductase family oxidoreductase n=1 Tax=Staphylococcus intermedius NCTC 11048 TaxID=1141106 RepID=A0A380G5M4_STAIN|nr:short chain dehydrogenase/reductase family oxidoreductase [Staphylococcus intermedius NCTC 11048]
MWKRHRSNECFFQGESGKINSKLLKRSFMMTQNNPTNRFYNEDFPKQYQA